MATKTIVTKEKLQYFKGKMWMYLTHMVSSKYTPASGDIGAEWDIEVKPANQSTSTPGVNITKFENANSIGFVFKNPDNTSHAVQVPTSAAMSEYDNADVGRQNRGQANESGWARVKDVIENWAFAYAKDATTGDVSVGVTIETQGEFADDLNIPLATEDYVNKNGGKIDKIKVNGTEQTITNKEVDLTVPTMNGSAGDFVAWNGKTDPSEKTSIQLVMSNDDYVEVQTKMADGNGTATETLIHRLVNQGYVDRTFRTEAQVAQQIADAQTGTFVKVDSYDDLPTEGVSGKIYLVPNNGSGQNVYDEYIWCIIAMMAGGGGGESPVYGYEKIGTTVVDLSGYVQESDLVEITEAEIDAMFA